MTNVFTSQPKVFLFVHLGFLLFLNFNVIVKSQPISGWERPGPCNTGPYDESVLVASGTITVNTDGAIIENIDVTGIIKVYANNVTIRNFRINANDWFAIRTYNDVTGLVIEDGEIINIKAEAISPASNFTARRIEVHESEGDAFKASHNTIIESCWMHHLGNSVGAHADAVQVLEGKNIIIQGNYMESPDPLPAGYNFNAALMASTGFGPIDNLVFDNNWADGGSFSIQIRNGGKGDATNLSASNNHFGGNYVYGIHSFDFPTTYEGNLEDPVDISTIPACGIGSEGDGTGGTTQVTGVTLSLSSLIISKGNASSLTETVLPSNANDKSVTWVSDNTSVATVDANGSVTGVAEGSATITVTTADGGFTATCSVTVVAAALTGSINRDYWENIGFASAVSDLTNNVNYPDNPTGSDGLSSLQAVSWNDPSVTANWGNQYGQRVYGYLHPPTSGDYIFWISADDCCDLYISTDDDPSNKIKVAFLNGYANPKVWDKSPDQKSSPVSMVAGQKYFIEILHREGGGNDHLEVGWAKPGESTSAPSEIVPGSVLSPYAPIPIIDVTSVSLSPTELILGPGQTSDLAETVLPANATDISVSWTTSNASIATVDANGIVSTLSSGQATITATTNNGGYTAQCSVTVSSSISVTSVTISQSKLFLGSGRNSTLTATVLPSNATNKSVTWSSDNNAVATVDANGVVSAQSGGQANITAMTNDGGYTSNCQVTVMQSSGLQLMNLDPPTSAKFTLTEIVWPENIGEADVCLWHEDKLSAATMTIDDNLEMQHYWWLDMQDKYPGLVFTWFCISDLVTDWNLWQDLIDAGNDVQAHDMVLDGAHCDINNATDIVYHDLFETVQNEINQNLTNNSCVTIGYPCGANRSDAIRDMYIAGRGTPALINKANQTDYLYILSRSGANDVNDINCLLDSSATLWGQSYYRGWLSYHYHYLNNFGPTEAFLAELHAQQDKIWIGRFSDVAKYGQERDTHTLTVIEINSDEIKFTLTDDMYDIVFDFPLTVKIRIPNNWTELYALQNGNPIDISLVTYNNNQYALVHAVPDRGEVELGATSKSEDEGTDSLTTTNSKTKMPDLSMRIWPNPVPENCKISFDLHNFNAMGTVKLEIYDITGKKVYSKDEFISNQDINSIKRIRLSTSLKRGIYIAVITIRGQIQKSKFVIE